MTATLNGMTVTWCRVQIPAWGVWFADVEIDRAEQLAGAATLVLADLTLKGTVMSGGPWQGRARYRIAGGAGKWGKVIPAKSEANDLGVKLSTAVGAAAAACGETLGSIPAGTIGPSFVRAQGPAIAVLNELVPEAWYVDEAGVTQFGRRPSRTYSGGATRLPQDKARGTIELAPTTIADLLPGVVVDGVEAVDVEHVLDTKLRTTIWGKSTATTANRVAGVLQKLVDGATAGHRYFAPYEYRVVLRTGERLELQIARVSTGMPNLSNVRVRPGVSGVRSYPALGSLVVVSFINGDPTRPAVTSYDEPESAGFIPAAISFEAGSTGTEATEHVTSAQALALFGNQLLNALSTALSGVPGAGAALTALAADPAYATFIATLEGAALGPLTKAAIGHALDAKTPNTAGDTPSIGMPSVRGG